MIHVDRPLPILPRPLWLAPMAGGPTSPALLAAVCGAGAGGFLPGGYLTASVLEKNLTELRDLLAAAGGREPAFGVNLFVPAPADPARDQPDVDAYAEQLGREAVAAGLDAQPGQPRWDDDDHYRDKLRLLVEVDPVPAVSFTFGCPTGDDVEALHRVGTSVAVTVTDREEALAARECGADALVVQGFDAGGHRGTHAVSTEPNRLDALALLPEVAGLGLPMLGAGGVATAGDVRRMLDAGAMGVQCGTAFLRCPEAGTSQAHRRLLREAHQTVVTRAFSGRPARGLRNGFIDAHPDTPAVNPQVDQVTKPIRAAATAAGNLDWISGWAGVGWAAAQDLPAAQVVEMLTEGL